MKKNCSSSWLFTRTVVAIHIFMKYMVYSTSKTGMSHLMIITDSRVYIHQFQNLKKGNYVNVMPIFILTKNKFIIISMATAI